MPLATKEPLTPSVSHWNQERDNLLDHVSHLQDNIARTNTFLMKVAKIHPEVEFDLMEAMLILNETRIDSDSRRFPEADTDVVGFQPTQKEVSV